MRSPRCGVAFGLFLAVILDAHAGDPGWWSAVIHPSETAATDNYAPANLGQLRNFAEKARDHLNLELSGMGGAGTEIESKISSWPDNPPDAYRPINLGQLKSVVDLFYARLDTYGLDYESQLNDNGYPASRWTLTSGGKPRPWNESAPSSSNYAPVNLGQLKMLFSFDLSGSDSDHDGIPDAWEMLHAPRGGLSYFDGTNGHDVDGDGVSDLQQYRTGTPASSSGAYPKLQDVVHPVPDPGLPSGSDYFAPPFNDQTPATGAAAIAEYTRSGRPGDRIALSGTFSSLTGADEGSDFYLMVYDPPSALRALKIDRLDAGDDGDENGDGDKAVAALDGVLSDGMYIVWPVNAQGVGYPAAINRTETWWLGPNVAVQGEKIAVYGRNLSRRKGTTIADSTVYLKPASGAGQWITPTEVNPYRVEFTVPNLPNGNYEIWTHNKMGGKYGWSGPLTLTIESDVPWTDTPPIVVDANLDDNNSVDDALAINAAIEAATGGPVSATSAANLDGHNRTIYLPNGTYNIKSNIVVPSHIRITGQSQSSTIIKASGAATDPFWSGWVKPWNKVIFSDMTIRLDAALAVDGAHCINGGVTDLRLYRLTLDAHEGRDFAHIWGPFYFQRPSDSADMRLYAKDCTFIGSSFGINIRQSFFTDCKFYGVFDGDLLSLTGDCSDISIIGCTGEDYDNAQMVGWSNGRFVKGRNGYGFRQNMYFGNNETTDLAVREADEVNQTQGEQIGFEQNFQKISFSPISATSNTVLIPSGLPISQPEKMGLAIVHGKGLGQYRTVSGVDGNTLSVDPPWRVPPDDTSTIVGIWGVSHVVGYHNHLDGKRPTPPFREDLSAGFLFFFGCFDCIADENTLSDLSYGIVADGMNTNLGPNFSILCENNEIANSRIGIELRAEDNDPNLQGVALFDMVFRKNTIRDSMERAIRISTLSNYLGRNIETAVFDSNTISGSVASPINLAAAPHSWDTPSQLGNVIFAKNTITFSGSGASSDPAIILVAGQRVDFDGNNFTGYSISYGFLLNPNPGTYDPAPPLGGTPIGPILELPVRNLLLVGSAGTTTHGSVAIHNAGTDALSWTATSDSSWLTLALGSGSASGSVSGSCANQSGSADASISLACDATGLSSGTHTAFVTVVSGAMTKKIKISFLIP